MKPLSLPAALEDTKPNYRVDTGHRTMPTDDAPVRWQPQSYHYFADNASKTAERWGKGGVVARVWDIARNDYLESFGAIANAAVVFQAVEGVTEEKAESCFLCGEERFNGCYCNHDD